ncbi:hypothetical protein E4T45_00954 [Aureobasidium sp. EXF-8846]|nr:hypothetical protein E4T45_00954 [Aureobasidium sp. EXF-8846]
MRSFILIAGAAALAVASPMPQDLNDASKVNLAEVLPELSTTTADIGNGTVTITYDPNAAAAAAAAEAANSPDFIDLPDKRSLEQRDACPAPPTEDTAENFHARSDFSAAATGASTPSGFAQAFFNQQASLEGCGYLGYKTYDTYDVASAAQECQRRTGCRGFNIFFERDPSVDPNYSDCKNPASTTVIKASFWGNNVAPRVATNVGQYRADFHVVIAGSNGYALTADSVTPILIKGYTQEVLGGCSINSKPTNCNIGQKDSFQKSWTAQDAFFDHGRCQAICDSQTNCRYFTSYMLVTNDRCGVQQCAFYKRAWSSSQYCTNRGQFNAQGDKVTIQWSSAFTTTKPDNGVQCPLVSSAKLFRA